MRRPANFLEPEDKEKIREHLPPWAQDFLDFAYEVGWPHGPMAALTWNEVDIPHRRFTLVGRERRNFLRKTTVPMLDSVVPVLERRRAYAKGDLVFHRGGHLITHERWNVMRRRAVKRAGVGDYTLQDIRKTVFKRLLEEGRPRKEVRLITGHSQWFQPRKYGITVGKPPNPIDRPIEPSANGEVTLLRVLQDYAKDYRLRGGRSYTSLRSDVKRLIDFFGDIPVSSMKAATIQEYRHMRHDGGAANGTINREVAVLKAAFNLSLRNEIISSGPRFPKRLPPGQPRQGFLTYSMWQKARVHLPEWAQDVFDLSYWTGWRRGEVFWLEWSEIDFEEGFIRLNPTRSKNTRGRPIPMTDVLREILEKQWAKRIAGLPYVFHREGWRISASYWYSVWHPARARAGYPNLNLHDCRRSVARDMRLSGSSETQAMRVTGHRSRYVFGHYEIMLHDDIRQRMDLMVAYRRRNGGSAPPDPEPKPKERPKPDVEGRLAEIIAELGIKKARRRQ